MRKIFGYAILSQHEIELQQKLSAQEKIGLEERLSVQTERANKAYQEVEYYRRKFEESQERADRQLDVFMTSVGMPEVTTTGRNEAAAAQQKKDDLQVKRDQELAELYGETMNTLHNEDGLELTPELQEASDQLLAELKTAEKA